MPRKNKESADALIAELVGPQRSDKLRELRKLRRDESSQEKKKSSKSAFNLAEFTFNLHAMSEYYERPAIFVCDDGFVASRPDVLVQSADFDTESFDIENFDLESFDIDSDG